jgi:hypothetical protein
VPSRDIGACSVISPARTSTDGGRASIASVHRRRSATVPSLAVLAPTARAPSGESNSLRSKAHKVQSAEANCSEIAENIPLVHSKKSGIYWLRSKSSGGGTGGHRFRRCQNNARQTLIFRTGAVSAAPARCCARFSSFSAIRSIVRVRCSTRFSCVRAFPNPRDHRVDDCRCQPISGTGRDHSERWLP